MASNAGHAPDLGISFRNDSSSGPRDPSRATCGDYEEEETHR